MQDLHPSDDRPGGWILAGGRAQTRRLTRGLQRGTQTPTGSSCVHPFQNSTGWESPTRISSSAITPVFHRFREHKTRHDVSEMRWDAFTYFTPSDLLGC